MKTSVSHASCNFINCSAQYCYHCYHYITQNLLFKTSPEISKMSYASFVTLHGGNLAAKKIPIIPHVHPFEICHKHHSPYLITNTLKNILKKSNFFCLSLATKYRHCKRQRRETHVTSMFFLVDQIPKFSWRLCQIMWLSSCYITSNTILDSV
jgi:hypothetical protein